MVEYLLAYIVIGMVVSMYDAYSNDEVLDTIHGLIAAMWPLWLVMTACLLLGEAWERWKKRRSFRRD